MAAIVVAGAGVPVCKHGARGASSLCGTADVLEALGVVIELSPDGVRRCVEEAGHRVLLRAAVPPGVPLRRSGAPGDRHPDGVQPARPDGQPGSGAPAGDRRRRRPLRRADAGVAAGPRLDRCVGRPRRRPRRADDHRPVDGARPRPRRRRAHVRGRSGRRSAWRRRPTSSSSAAIRRTTPTSCGACSTASTAPTATSSCSTPPPRWSSPASPTTSPAGASSRRGGDRRRPGRRRRWRRWCEVSQEAAGS